MSNIIDRRPNGKNKSTGIRQKFIKRARGAIKKAVKEAVDKKQVSDISNPGKESRRVRIPSKGIGEPNFKNGDGGDKDFIIPGNSDMVVGDRIKKPQGGQGGSGNEGSPDGEGEDDFAFTLSRDEFLDFFFEDLELPDLVKTQLKEINDYKMNRAGYVTEGTPNNLDIVRSMRNAIGRRIALQSGFQEELLELQEKLKKARSQSKRDELKKQIKALEDEIDNVPFIDDIDIRYRAFTPDPQPAHQAVMFCLMDVSASMGEGEKELAKRFFMLLYMFLTKKYDKIEVVFVRHTQNAKEVDEHEFFYGRESGGTVVSSALKKMHEIVRERYDDASWNIYAAQASDGDNWSSDGQDCQNLMNQQIMPLVQYFAYVQIGRDSNYSSYGMYGMPGGFDGEKQLWKDYAPLVKSWKNFRMEQIDEPKDIFPVFRKLFEKKV